jgi:hypothetical protein
VELSYLSVVPRRHRQACSDHLPMISSLGVGGLDGILSFTRGIVVFASVLVVCWQDRRSTVRSGRAGGSSRLQLGGCETTLSGGFTRRRGFTFCWLYRLYLGGCGDFLFLFPIFDLFCKRFPSLLCIGLAVCGFIYKAGRKPISRRM